MADESPHFLRPKVEHLPEQVVHKWSSEILSEGFVPLPKKFLRTMADVMEGNSFDHLQALFAIVDYLRPNLRNPPSVEYLAFVAGLTPERFKECLDGLAKQGLIEYEGQDVALRFDLGGLKKKITEKSGD